MQFEDFYLTDDENQPYWAGRLIKMDDGIWVLVVFNKEDAETLVKKVESQIADQYVSLWICHNFQTINYNEP